MNRHRRSVIRPLFFFLSAAASSYKSGVRDGVHRCRGVLEKSALFPRTIFAAPLAKIPPHGALPLSGIPLYRRVRFSLRRIFSISALFGCLTRLADCSAKRAFPPTIFCTDSPALIGHFDPRVRRLFTLHPCKLRDLLTRRFSPPILGLCFYRWEDERFSPGNIFFLRALHLGRLRSSKPSFPQTAFFFFCINISAGSDEEEKGTFFRRDRNLKRASMNRAKD